MLTIAWSLSIIYKPIWNTFPTKWQYAHTGTLSCLLLSRGSDHTAPGLQSLSSHFNVLKNNNSVSVTTPGGDRFRIRLKMRRNQVSLKKKIIVSTNKLSGFGWLPNTKARRSRHEIYSNKNRHAQKKKSHFQVQLEYKHFFSETSSESRCLDSLIGRINNCPSFKTMGSASVLRTGRLRAQSWAAPPVSAASCHSVWSRRSAPAAAWASGRRQSPGCQRSLNCPFQKVSPWQKAKWSSILLTVRWWLWSHFQCGTLAKNNCLFNLYLIVLFFF